MSYSLLSLKHPTARKDHRCIWCGGKIPKGADYVHESSVYYGEMQNHHWHPDCYEYSRDDMDWEFTPYDNERPEQPEESSEAERVKAGA